MPRQGGDLPTIFYYGTKFDGLVWHFRADPRLLDRDDYTLIPDDDVIIKARDTINRFFGTVVEHDPTVAPPAMAVNSYPEDTALGFQSSSMFSRSLAIWPCNTFRRINSEERKSMSLKFIRFRPAIRFLIDWARSTTGW
jgi:hypothetical protein